MSSRSKHVYVIGDVAFVPAAATPSGLWVRTHACVLKVKCSICDVKAGELCRNKAGQPITGVHYMRPRAAKGKKFAVDNVVFGVFGMKGTA